VGWETEATKQDIIEREFNSQAVISVIHRLRHVERYDRVTLTKHGRLVEYTSPSELLMSPSEFATFYNTKKATQ
jgi:ABC-type multidrug transport system fused ATPase/permease subunit